MIFRRKEDSVVFNLIFSVLATWFALAVLTVAWFGIYGVIVFFWRDAADVKIFAAQVLIFGWAPAIAFIGANAFSLHILQCAWESIQSIRGRKYEM